MAAANGFVTERPDATFGTATGTHSDTELWGQRFITPDVGTLTITEIGVFGAYAASTNVHRWGIFTHDAANDCPSDLVTNSWTDAQLVGATTEIHLCYWTYATQPVTLEGNTWYWMCGMQSGSWSYTRKDTSDTAALYAGGTYGTWPTAASWETHTDRARQYCIYAVYEAAGATSDVIMPIMMNYYMRLHK